MDERLERLIEEQRQDMARGEFQYPEPGVESYDRFESGSDPEFAMQIGRDRLTRERPECAYHGRAHLRQQPGTFYGWMCRECERDAARRYLSKDGVREKVRETTRIWKAEHRERVNAYERDYKKRRYHEDPEYRARELARKRAYKQRMKEAKHAEVQGPAV